VEEVWLERDELLLDDGTVLPYDVLIVASGVRLQPEETEGLAGPGWNQRVFTFYNSEGAEALRGALERFDGGRLVVNLVDMPIKCPVAPRRWQDHPGVLTLCLLRRTNDARRRSTTRGNRGVDRYETVPICQPCRRCKGC